MSTLDEQIRAWLETRQFTEAELHSALGAVLDLCDMFAAAPDADTLHAPILHAIADDLREAVATHLGITQEPDHA